MLLLARHGDDAGLQNGQPRLGANITAGGDELDLRALNFYNFFDAVVHVTADFLAEHAAWHIVGAPQLNRHRSRFVSFFPSEDLREERLPAGLACWELQQVVPLSYEPEGSS